MIVKTITYTDYDGNARTEQFYFNLSKSEIVELECSKVGGLSKSIEKMMQSPDPTVIVPLLKDIILKSYGEKSPDGKRFVKSPELSNAFYQTEAYSELIMELLGDAKKASEFINATANLSTDEIEEAKKRANISALPTV